MGFYQLHKTQKNGATLDEVWDFKEYFVDEQRVGPYAIWHHEHKMMAFVSPCRLCIFTY